MSELRVNRHDRQLGSPQGTCWSVGLALSLGHRGGSAPVEVPIPAVTPPQEVPCPSSTTAVCTDGPSSHATSVRSWPTSRQLHDRGAPRLALDQPAPHNSGLIDYGVHERPAWPGGSAQPALAAGSSTNRRACTRGSLQPSSLLTRHAAGLRVVPNPCGIRSNHIWADSAGIVQTNHQ